MLRFLVRRVPRFGFVTLFAAMLLFVSVAGWAKWHLDLWQEEEALLADLAKAGVGVTYKRGWAEYVETKPKPKPATPTPVTNLSTPIVPFISRIESVHIQEPESEAFLERAAALPNVNRVSGQGQPPGAIAAEAIAAKAGFELQPLTPSAPLSDKAPLPHGPLINGAEAETAVARFAEGWKAGATAPTRGKAHTVRTLPAVHRQFYVRDKAVRFAAFEGAFAITTPHSHETFLFDGARFRQNSRLNDSQETAEMFMRESPPLIMFDERTCFEKNLERYGIGALFAAALDTPSEILVEQHDEGRVRLDLPPLVRKFPAADCDDSVLISLILRSDLDWAPEAWDMRASRSAGPTTPPNLPPMANASYRGTLRREGDWIVAEEWIADWLGPARLPVSGFPAHLVPFRTSGAARYDFTSDLDLSHVTPELFDAKMLPPQRELPWLRWYRLTFGLSLALFVWVAVRRLSARRRPREVSPA